MGVDKIFSPFLLYGIVSLMPKYTPKRKPRICIPAVLVILLILVFSAGGCRIKALGPELPPPPHWRKATAGLVLYEKTIMIHDKRDVIDLAPADSAKYTGRILPNDIKVVFKSIGQGVFLAWIPEIEGQVRIVIENRISSNDKSPCREIWAAAQRPLVTAIIKPDRFTYLGAVKRKIFLNKSERILNENNNIEYNCLVETTHDRTIDFKTLPGAILDSPWLWDRLTTPSGEAVK